MINNPNPQSPIPHSMLDGPHQPPRSGGKAKQLILLLHGWGADGANLIDLADAMNDAVPDAHFIAPNGPEVCEVNPYGFQWFSLQNRDPKVMLEGLKKSEKILNHYIDSTLDELELGDKDLALVGFSQGTMLALHTALRRPVPMGAVVGFSGALIAGDVLAKASVSKVPVSLIHGQYDDVVPYASLAQAANALTEFGINVETHTRPMLGHSIDMPGIEAAKDFLKKNLLG